MSKLNCLERKSSRGDTNRFSQSFSRRCFFDKKKILPASCLPSLKLTFSHWKIDGWKMTFLLEPGLFSDAFAVSFRECTDMNRSKFNDIFVFKKISNLFKDIFSTAGGFGSFVKKETSERAQVEPQSCHQLIPNFHGWSSPHVVLKPTFNKGTKFLWKIRKFRFLNSKIGGLV